MRPLRAALAAAAVLGGMLGITGIAAAHEQDCGEALVCAQVDPRVDPQVGPVVGPNEFDFEGIFG